MGSVVVENQTIRPINSFFEELFICIICLKKTGGVCRKDFHPFMVKEVYSEYL